VLQGLETSVDCEFLSFVFYSSWLLSIVYYSAWEQCCNQSVCLCLSVHKHVSGTAGPIFKKFVMQIPCGHGSVLLWRHCDMLCTSGFMDDVKFVRNGPYGDACLALAALWYRYGGVWCLWLPFSVLLWVVHWHSSGSQPTKWANGMINRLSVFVRNDTFLATSGNEWHTMLNQKFKVTPNVATFEWWIVIDLLHWTNY